MNIRESSTTIGQLTDFSKYTLADVKKMQDINQRDKINLMTPLMHACMKLDVRTVYYLFKRGVNYKTLDVKDGMDAFGHLFVGKQQKYYYVKLYLIARLFLKVGYKLKDQNITSSYSLFFSNEVVINDIKKLKSRYNIDVTEVGIENLLTFRNKMKGSDGWGVKVYSTREILEICDMCRKEKNKCSKTESLISCPYFKMKKPNMINVCKRDFHKFEFTHLWFKFNPLYNPSSMIVLDKPRRIIVILLSIMYLPRNIAVALYIPMVLFLPFIDYWYIRLLVVIQLCLVAVSLIAFICYSILYRFSKD